MEFHRDPHSCILTSQELELMKSYSFQETFIHKNFTLSPLRLSLEIDLEQKLILKQN